VFVKDIAVPANDDEGARVALLATGEPLISLSSLALLFVVALQAAVVFNEDLILV
jgi:hypothetical protein